MASPSGRGHSNRAFSECPVQVMAGSGRSIYYVHPEVLASCNSPVLDARMNWPWKNNDDDKPLDWSDFDEQTVVCVLNYLYTRDYHVPESPSESAPSSEGIIQGQSNEENEDVQSELLPQQSPSVSGTGQSQDQPQQPVSLLEPYIEIDLLVESQPTAVAASTQVSKQCNGGMGEAILTHAKVYHFAHYFMVPELEDFALQRLAQALGLAGKVDKIKMQELFPQLADAIRVVYDGTMDAEKSQDRARKLLSQFVALEYSALSGQHLNALLAEGGEFAIDVPREISRRVVRVFQLHNVKHAAERDLVELESKRRRQKRRPTGSLPISE